MSIMNADIRKKISDELYEAISQRLLTGIPLHAAIAAEIDDRFRPRVHASGRTMTPLNLAGPEVVYEDEIGRSNMPRTLWQVEAFAELPL